MDRKFYSSECYRSIIPQDTYHSQNESNNAESATRKTFRSE
jgi:hypothetical protein